MTSEVKDPLKTLQSEGYQILNDLFLDELEDRSAPRILLSLPTHLKARNAPSFSVTVNDLSLSGFSCKALSPMPHGTCCWLKIPGMEPIQAQVVWNDGSMIGCSFDKLLSQKVLDSLIARYSEPTRYNI